MYSGLTIQSRSAARRAAQDLVYIMMKCVFVCLSQKMITSHFWAERWRRKVSRPLGRSWPSDDDGVGDCDGADDEGGGNWGSEVEVLK